MFEERLYIIEERIKNIMKTFSDNNDHSLNEIYDKVKFYLIERDVTRDIFYQKKLSPMPGTYGTNGPAQVYVYDFYYPINNYEQILKIEKFIYNYLNFTAFWPVYIKFIDNSIVWEMRARAPYNFDKDEIMDEVSFQKYVISIQNHINNINGWLEQSNNILKQEIIDKIESLNKKHKKIKQHEEDYEDYDNNEYDAGRSPNDQRSDVYNPNNPDYKAAMDNRSNQLNPNNPAYHSSRGRR
jgi:hypothetical protein